MVEGVGAAAEGDAPAGKEESHGTYSQESWCEEGGDLEDKTVDQFGLYTQIVPIINIPIFRGNKA